MSLEAPKFYRESWKDGYIHELQSKGSLLLGTARKGDVKAKKVIFPIIGEVNAVKKLTGALTPVTMPAGGLNTVEVDLDDFETDPEWIFTPDLEKIGPNLKQASQEKIAWSVGRKRDMIQLDALAAFTADGATDHGGAAIRPNPLTFSAAKVKIMQKGGLTPGKIFVGVPSMAMEQLKYWQYFAKAEWRGPDDLPLTKMAMDKTTWNGIHFIVLPDVYFRSPDGDASLYYYMWHADCIGVENNWGDITTFVQVPTMQGNPWMVKVGFGAAALGILRDGVQRLRFENIDNLVEPTIKIEEVV